MGIEVVEGPEYTNLTSLANVKRALGISNSENDEYLNDLIAASSAEVETRTGRTFARQTVIETLPSKGTTELILSITPIMSVEYVAYDGTNLDENDWNLLDAGAGFVQKPTGFKNTSIPFNTIDLAPSSSYQDLWSVKYTGGYALPEAESESDFPRDLERAVIQMVKAQFLSNDFDPGMTRYKIGDTQVQWAEGAGSIPKSAENVLRYYTRPF